MLRWPRRGGAPEHRRPDGRAHGSRLDRHFRAHSHTAVEGQPVPPCARRRTGACRSGRACGSCLPLARGPRAVPGWVCAPPGRKRGGHAAVAACRTLPPHLGSRRPPPRLYCVAMARPRAAIIVKMIFESHLPSQFRGCEILMVDDLFLQRDVSLFDLPAGPTYRLSRRRSARAVAARGSAR